MVPTFFPDLKLTLASRALSRGKSELFIAFLSSLELVQPDTIKKRAKNPKNRGKTLNYFPNLGLDPNFFPSPPCPANVNFVHPWVEYTIQFTIYALPDPGVFCECVELYNNSNVKLKVHSVWTDLWSGERARVLKTFRPSSHQGSRRASSRNNFKDKGLLQDLRCT